MPANPLPLKLFSVAFVLLDRTDLAATGKLHIRLSHVLRPATSEEEAIGYMTGVSLRQAPAHQIEIIGVLEVPTLEALTAEPE